MLHDLEVCFNRSFHLTIFIATRIIKFELDQKKERGSHTIKNASCLNSLCRTVLLMSNVCIRQASEIKSRVMQKKLTQNRSKSRKMKLSRPGLRRKTVHKGGNPYCDDIIINFYITVYSTLTH